MSNLQSASHLPWDSARGAELWAALPADQQQAQLTQNDALIWASLGVRVLPDGCGVRQQTWREIKAGQP